MGITLNILVPVVFALLYAFGGRDREDFWKGFGWLSEKYTRRFIGGLFLPAAVVGLSLYRGSYEHWFLLSFLAYPLALSQGYGVGSMEVTLWNKIKRRSKYGVLLGLAAFIFANPVVGLKFTLILATVQCALSVAASLVLGILNPFRFRVNDLFDGAAFEEMTIAFLSVCIVPWLV